MNTTKCPGCPGRRNHGQYLCRACWRALPASTRGRLGRRDARAFLRLRQLHQALAAKTPIAIIRVSP
ncbi:MULTISPECIES: hypothetical protein [Streptomyces]|uniref:Uncharacterized protein n=1 Tax=Streptomyces europaeiscabiei TaxID=146819 RepID=A0ABU4NQW5_9ACTN|nr:MULTISPECIES: hypothetical protein [Streptomyces]MBP5922149.1 hypothetical protein [Streptomyces sp. LBUM 1483]MDX3555219.1 hypothetical protein [Streptomyces europaeiscabiei]MDX3705233.1 hypothetical protein [Streptomyces europaeiscabiei]MDX3864356.1 hypothetical protein [Streptomyces europaeiscabiei]MDX3871562.1 hypothetical protein [Streptomyces europaeiscabiei]